MATEHEPQRIARLTPVADVLARIDALVKPVAPREIPIYAALGRTLASDVAVGPCPPVPIALRDGWAVNSERTTDASSYAPVLLPAATWVDVGNPIPADADAVAPLDSVTARNGRTEISVPVISGDGVLQAGADADPRVPLAQAGRRLKRFQYTAVVAANVEKVAIRWPGVHVVRARPVNDAMLGAVSSLLVGEVVGAGGNVLREEARIPALDTALTDETAAAVIAIGGTGSGSRDRAVTMLARAGRVEVHGVALTPGETTAFGFVESRPVLLLPGRIDAALAAWFVLGRPLLARLCGRTETEATVAATLARKVASPLGLTEVVPVRCRDGKAEPIASGYWPLQAIAQADGWIMVGADSEGYPAGAEVVLNPWP